MRIQCDGATDLTGDLVVKSFMGKSFDAFRKILREQKLDSYFRESCFGQYLNLLEDNNTRFQMKIVYDLLKHRFMYENKDKMDKVWINYCGMPIFFGWEEFAIVTGLKYYPPSPSQVIPTLTQKKAPCTPKKGKGKSSDRDDQMSIAGPSFKNKNLIEVLKGKGLSKKHKQSLCLVWFVHNVLWARDVNNNISLGLINLSEDLEAFNSYPWGYESFKMTVEYLLTPLTPKTVNLYGFPWAFMAWAFEVIPYLRQQVNYQKEVSYPRILRWLSAKTNKNAKFLDLFNPPKEEVLAVVVLKERRIRVNDSMSRRRHFRSSSEIQKLAKLLPTYLDMSGFLDQKVCTDWSTIEAYRDKMDNPFDLQYVERIVQQANGSLDCGPFVAAYAEYLSNELQVPNDGLDAELLCKRYASLLWKYGEAKAQKPYATDVKDP
ncbi:hypothetical protein BC332_06718 [Capsicum chinense]|nr:hypothetical protein BC332_06718 [Capsicum chinense]